eukprot:TRINITY_DN6112_c0_g1_i1.p1 TRINITY_DN6112_c0_g1~~TRINITY_DN6112_c0_g1_i1.p1  ORF type:complete len:791 (+),score=170.48 TRINITY_DN6112_c0_g1_i1:119-2491(+)
MTGEHADEGLSRTQSAAIHTPLPGTIWASCVDTLSKLPQDTHSFSHFKATAGLDLPEADVTGSVVRSLSPPDILATVSALAMVLREKWYVQAGNRVVLAAENCVEWAIVYFAVSSIGGTVMQLDPAMPTADLRALIKRCDAAAVIVSPAVASKLRNDFGCDPATIPILNVRDSGLAPVAAPPTHPRTEARAFPDDDAVVATVIFTSGTTGAPKGVMLTHRGVLWVIDAVVDRVGLCASDTVVMVLPLHHVLPFMALMGLMLVGGKAVFVDVLDVDLVPHANVAGLLVASMRLTRPTLLVLVPVFYERMCAKVRSGVAAKPCPVRCLLSCMSPCVPARTVYKAVHERYGGQVRMMVSGGAALSATTATYLLSLGFDVVQGYGMSESSGIISAVPPGRGAAGSVGLPFRGVDVKITPEGEVCARGPHLMKGYFRDPAETAATIVDGWLRTGDRGEIAADGMLTITGRLKELIVTDGGKKIAPAAVEEAYGTVEGALEYAVYGRATDRNTDLIACAVVLDRAAFPESVSVPAAEGTVRRRFVLAGTHHVDEHYRIQHFAFVNVLPKTAKMSVKRRLLDRIVKQRETETITTSADAGGSNAASTDAAAAPPSRPPTALEDEVIQACGRLRLGTAGPAGLTPQSHLQYDVALDSMALVQLLAGLAHAHGDIPLAPAFKRAFNSDAFDGTIGALATLVAEVEQHGLRAGGCGEPVPAELLAARPPCATAAALGGRGYEVSGVAGLVAGGSAPDHVRVTDMELSCRQGRGPARRVGAARWRVGKGTARPSPSPSSSR